jgi:hypothetical protein
MNRIMQENIKNTVEQISEDVRKNWIKGVASSIPDSNCDSGGNSEWSQYKQWNKLCTWVNQYYLARYDFTSETWQRTDNDYCADIKNTCSIFKLDVGLLTNSLVSVKKLDFYYSENYVDKVSINITLRPAIKKWLKSELVNENELIFQTTISKRVF